VHIFYTPDLIADDYTLNETESKHCVKVLRLKENDVIQLIDGKGKLCLAKIVDASPKYCAVKIIETEINSGKKNYSVSIAIAPTKNINRFETFLEKATEIGIDEIYPLKTAFSERVVIKLDRLEKVIISAAKQSIKAFLPTLNDITDFKTIIKNNFDGQKFIAHCYDTAKENLADAYIKGNNALILIGPEGDFSIEEVEKAKTFGFIEVSLSTSRLRTETAGVVACDTIHILNLKK
jgi:16S rRNA (uracil1498-N3)-methyltransferase